MKSWYKKGIVAYCLLPFSLLFLAVVFFRRKAYQMSLCKTEAVDARVIIVGNLSVGGTGKTPLVIHLAHCFLQQGDHPIIITRGYKGENTAWPIKVAHNSDPVSVGDEAVLLAQRAGCPVYAGPNRVATAQRAILQEHCPPTGRRIILSDDGLQHYRLQRDIEIAVIDGIRAFGNGWLLPAGPLREPLSRLNSVDFKVMQGAPVRQHTGFIMHLQGDICVALQNPKQQRPLLQFQGHKVHAVAAIGHPERFFKSLETQGLEVLRHPFADHHAFSPKDIDFKDDLPVIMTEKDAVKCRAFAQNEHWYLPVDVCIDPQLFNKINAALA